MNSLFKIGIVGSIGYGIYKLLGMKRISDKGTTSLSNPRIHAVNLKGMVIKTGVSLSNPTKSSMNITKPIITLTTNGKYITSTNPENKKITINPMTSTFIDTFELVVPWTVLAGYIAGLISKIPQLLIAFTTKDMKAFAKVLSIPLEMKYSLYANGLSYESQPVKIL